MFKGLDSIKSNLRGMRMSSLDTIIWLVTGKCNLACKHCYASMYKNESDLPLEAVKKVISDASEIGVRHIHYTGGEPLSRKDIDAILAYTLDNGIRTSIFSNLILISESFVKKLARWNVKIYTSVDAPSKDVFEKIRGEGTWNKMLNGLMLLLEAGIEPHVNITISEVNWPYIGETISFLLSKGIESISLIPAMPVGRALENDIYVRAEHFKLAVLQALEIAREQGIVVPIWCAPFIGIITEEPYFSYRNCRDWNVMDITPSGRVVLCDVLNIEITNLRENGLGEAYQSLITHPLYKKAIKPQLKGPCKTCSIRNECRGGCYARAFLIRGDLNAPDPLCPKARG